MDRTCAIVVLAAVLWRACSAEGNDEGATGYVLSEAELAELQPGDIIPAPQPWPGQ
ncbi:MAG: hypothetical protein IPF41_12285 [Flavobacteriales bacterium]|nr:hypothetical protein [Flavobacteriales bacterium]